jgi:hypothetical protein
MVLSQWAYLYYNSKKMGEKDRKKAVIMELENLIRKRMGTGRFFHPVPIF